MKLNFMEKKAYRRLTIREFVLISAFFIIFELYMMVNYILIPKWEEYSKIRDKVKTITTVSDSLEKEYLMRDKLKEQVENLDYKIGKLSEQVPPYISDVDIILTLDKFAKINNVAVDSIAFDNTEIMPVESFMKGLDKDKNSGNVTENSSSSKKEEKSIIDEGPTVFTKDITLSFSGSYNELYAFLADMEENTKTICLKEITLNRSNANLLKGGLRFSYTGYKESKDIGEYKLDVPQIDGKTGPFMPYEGYPEEGDEKKVSGDSSKAPQKRIDPNFLIVMNTKGSNAPKFTIGEFGKVSTEIYSNENNKLKGNFTISKSNGKYVYTYTLGNSTRTEEKKIVFEDNIIRLYIIAEERYGDEDKVSIEMDVNNETNIPLEITIKNDDVTRPRFILAGASGNVTVKK